jgi:hypothetical protein
MVYKVWVEGSRLALETRSKRLAKAEADHWRRFGFSAEVSWTLEKTG